ncbi:DUF3500 domain-containing protein [Rhodococcus sp. 14-2483-1-2]|uniref:DUF3500 domain-containing protein n=1 Tax=Rhodococcus sp. 14-2483-1-2 TaxID=2023147 RepID=UPI000B9B9CA3|nr:DUF3500 domain-containing protein [Rhodococcus sp. 14-2483-1-2]OZF26116.1 hypothetical protein CH295_26180 [Rhodococcus sp. 14-2483-1-2]OZF26126.1 hypothetical protein CH295_26245 [Rhodococcus sp. 14-2483-1-2]
MTIDNFATKSPSRRDRTRTAIVSALLAGGLVLSGCTSAATPSSSTATTSALTTSSTASASTADATTTAQTISDSAQAAAAFLATLSDEQREQLTYAYDDETKTTSWSNFPVTFVDRAGLNLADLTEEQQTAALAVLSALLSDEGYETVTGIMGGDEYLHENSSSTEESLGQYYIAFFGDPSDTTAWEIQFGGHHLGINATLDGSQDAITFAPTHLGIQPAAYTGSDGNEVQPFDGIYTSAFAFYDSLTDEQKATLYQGETVANMVCAPGSTCDFPTGNGISGADLTDEQKQLLLDVIANWAGLADEQTTSDALAKIEATLDSTYVNWSGATTYDMTQGDGIYFQISGPNAYVEFAAQQGSAGADVEGVTTSGWGHVHTIYRDPTNDYAGSATQQAATGGMGGAAPSGSDGPGATETPSSTTPAGS